jgi:hypothetical protein
MPSTLRALAREPVVHFAIIGAVLFALDGAASPGETVVPAAERCPLAAPSGPIVVDEEVRATLIEHWSRTHAAAPSAAERDRLVQGWIDEEVLYREGLRRGLAESDPRIRERVAAQMAYVLGSRISVPEPEEAELQAWHSAHAERYAKPERVDLTLVFVDGTSDAAEARARELLRLLEGGASPNGLGDTFAGGRRLRGRRLVELGERFGEAFVTGLREQPPGTWSLRRSPFGVHLVRVDGWTSSATPDFEAVREAVRHDWAQDQRARALAAAKQDLRARWEIVVSP